MKIFALLLALSLTTQAFCLISSDSPSSTSTEQAPILDPELSIFADLMIKAGIGDLFKGTGPFTGFIPTNEAFKKLGQKKLNELSEEKNQDYLAKILMYHIVPGKYLARNLKTAEIKTINGKFLEITVDNGQIKVNNAKVIKTDLIGPNGAIQEIDTVLFP